MIASTWGGLGVWHAVGSPLSEASGCGFNLEELLKKEPCREALTQAACDFRTTSGHSLTCLYGSVAASKKFFSTADVKHMSRASKMNPPAPPYRLSGASSMRFLFEALSCSAMPCSTLPWFEGVNSEAGFRSTSDASNGDAARVCCSIPKHARKLQSSA